MADAERSGIHTTGADSGFPVAGTAEAQPHKNGSGTDDSKLPKANEVLAGVVHATTEVQIATITGFVEGTKATFSFDGQTTSELSPGASASTLQTALRALSNIGPEDVVVSGENGGPYRIVFQEELEDVDVKQLTITGIGRSEVVEIVIKGAKAGKVKITFGGKTAEVKYNASAAEVQTALRALSSIGGENVNVAGEAGKWTITFTKALAETNVGAVTTDTTGLEAESEKVAEATVTVKTGGLDKPVGTVETQVQG